MISALVIGASGGIGQCTVQQLAKSGYRVTGWSSSDLDLNCPERIFDTDLSTYDLIVNAAGHSQGTYLGFQQNTWDNQLSQIMVNYVSNLALVKHYADQRDHGKYVWISTSLLDGARPFHSVYASTKQASRTALELIQQEIDHIKIVEIQVGPTRTNFRQRNFLHTRSAADVNTMYDQDHAHAPDYVAEQIVLAVDQNLSKLQIT
jgi:short-subunit dehydrogenase